MIRGLRTHEGGFTLVELMVVLSVTVALLSSALLVFRGRVPRTQFASAVNSLNVQLTDISNEVVSGYYPNQNNFECSINSGSGQIEVTAGSQQQGTNEECIYIGRAIQFAAGSQCSIPRDDKCGEINVYTVIGKRVNGSIIVTKLDDAEPIITTESQSNFSLGYGTYITKVQIGEGPGPTTELGGIAYMQTFGGAKLTGSDIPTGAPQVGIVPLESSIGLGLGQPAGTFVTSVNNPGNLGPPRVGLYATPNPKEGITVCLRSSGSDQYAILKIAVDGRTNISEPQVLEKTDWDDKCN